jgi:hypothetical protein
MCCVGVNRVVRTTELQGTTGCHGNLMENWNRRTRRGSFGQTRPLTECCGLVGTEQML